MKDSLLFLLCRCICLILWKPKLNKAFQAKKTKLWLQCLVENFFFHILILILNSYYIKTHRSGNTTIRHHFQQSLEPTLTLMKLEGMLEDFVAETRPCCPWLPLFQLVGKLRNPLGGWETWLGVDLVLPVYGCGRAFLNGRNLFDGVIVM